MLYLIFTVSGARHPLCDSHFKRLLRHQIPSRRSSATLLSQRSSCAMARHVGAQLPKGHTVPNWGLESQICYRNSVPSLL